MRGPWLIAALIGVGAGCTRSFEAPNTSVVLQSVTPASGFAGQLVLLQGQQFATGADAQTLNQVRFGTTPAVIIPDGGSTGLVVEVPQLGSGASTAQVSVVTNGVPAAVSPSFSYLGPGHPVGFSPSAVSDLSPSPGPLAVMGGVEATSLFRRWVVSLFEPVVGFDLPFAGNVGVNPVAAAVFRSSDAGVNGAWFLESSVTNELGGTYAVNVIHVSDNLGGPGPLDGSFSLCGVSDPRMVVPLGDRLLLLVPEGGVDAGSLTNCYQTDAGPGPAVIESEESAPAGTVIATTAALDPTGSTGWIAALSECVGGQSQCVSIRNLQADGGVVLVTGPLALPPDAGPPYAAIALDRLGTALYLALADPTDPSAISVTVGLPIHDGVPDPTRERFIDLPVGEARHGMVASDRTVASLVLVPPALDIASGVVDGGGLPLSVSLPGIPQYLAADPLSPDHYFVATASPPQVVEVDALVGSIISTRPLASGLASATESPSGAHLAVTLDRLPGMAILDASDLSLPPPDFTVPNVAFGTPFQQANSSGGFLLPLLEQATWVGEDVLCGLNDTVVGHPAVLCGVAQYLAASLLAGPPCELVGALQGPQAVLRADSEGGLVVYSGGEVQRFGISDAGFAAGPLGIPLLSCTAGSPSPPGTLDPNWTFLSVAPDGQGGVEAVPGMGLEVFFSDGGAFVPCTQNPLCPTADDIQNLVVDPAEQRVLVELSNLAYLVAPGSPGTPLGVLSMDLEGDSILSQAFSPDATRLYVGTALGRIYEFAPTLPFPPLPPVGVPPAFTSPTRIAILGFPVRSITVDPTGTRLIAFGFDSDQLWVVQ